MCVVRAEPLPPTLKTLASAAFSHLRPRASAMSSFPTAPSPPGPLSKILTSYGYQLVSC